MAGEYDVIAPPSTTVKFKGGDLTIAPLKVGQIPAFARAIKPIASAMGMTGLDVASIMMLFADYGENIIEAVSIASGVSQDQLNDSTADELVELASTILKVNADFFKGRLTPAILAAVQAHQTPEPAKNGDGRTQ